MKRFLFRFKKSQANFLTVGLLVAAIGVGWAGAHQLGSGSAATATYTHNPDGDADYCTLENNTTVLYGWANDPDAPAGALPNVSIKIGSNAAVTVATSQIGYRDAPINTYIKSTYPGMPTSTTYGWRLAISGLYRGSSYIVSGTVINYGSGTNMALKVNTSHNVDSNTTKPPFNTNGSIPNSCLATKPTPTSDPIPTPTPTLPAKTTPRPATPPSPTIINNADATVTTGTMAASLSIPADNATTLHVLYGLDPANLNLTTSNQPTNNALATVLLSGLTAKATYSYQIVRVLGAQTVASPANSFTTKGYDLALLFTATSKPMAGIVGELNGVKATSDKDGLLNFNDLAAGSYNPTFSYKGHTYSQSFSTDTIVASDKPVATSLQQTIDLDKLTTTAVVKSTQAAKPSPLIALVGGIVGLLIATIVFVLRRLSHRDPHTRAYVPSTPDIINPKNHAHFNKKTSQSPEPAPENIGKSLREMVLESIRAEAAKRKDKPPQ